MWGQRPLLTRAAELPRDYSDLLSPAMDDEIVAERGVRTPFVRMAREGILVDRACFTRSAGFGAQIADQLDPDGVLTQYAACLLYTSPSPRDKRQSRMPSSA